MVIVMVAEGRAQRPGTAEPGLLTWILPSGRRYTTAPEPYPA